MSRLLRALAVELGAELSYWTTAGERKEAGDEALLALCGALGWPLGSPDEAAEALGALTARRSATVLEPTILVRAGEPLRVRVTGHATEAELAFEWGAGIDIPVALSDATQRSGAELVVCDATPAGYHTLRVEVGGQTVEATVIAHPGQVRGFGLGAREWGAFAPLYALGPHPVYADLDRLGTWIEPRQGTVVGTLPLLATFPWDLSPYQPVSRRFWSGRYVEQRLVPPASGETTAHPVDEAADLAEFARFCVCAAHSGAGWRSPSFRWIDAGVDASFDAEVAEEVRRLRSAAAELAATAERISSRGQRLYLDLPLGCHSDGYDTWKAPDRFAPGVSVGAPPDDFFSRGQNWGFPPLLPDRSRADGHLGFREAVAHHMAVAGVLRIDHVMQLHRLFWIPDGFDGPDGVYVRNPCEELMAVLALESERAGCVVVGEDLGTVPDEVRSVMDDWGMPGMWVAEFAMDDWPGAELRLPLPGSVASVDTHDTPTFAGWRKGRDMQVLDDLGLLDHDSATVASAGRSQQLENLQGWLRARGHLADAGGAADAASDVELHAALLEAMGSSDATVVLVTVEDLWGEVEPQNVPGTPSDRPNWAQPLRHRVDELPGLVEVERVLTRLAVSRGFQVARE